MKREKKTTRRKMTRLMFFNGAAHVKTEILRRISKAQKLLDAHAAKVNKKAEENRITVR